MAVMAPAVSILATNLRCWATGPITVTLAAGAAWTAAGAAAVAVDPMLLFGMLALVPTLTFARPAVRPRPARPPSAPSSSPVVPWRTRRSPGADDTPAVHSTSGQRACHQTPGAPVPAAMTAGAPGHPDPRPDHVTHQRAPTGKASGPSGAQPAPDHTT
jgi:hypothetical protein